MYANCSIGYFSSLYEHTNTHTHEGRKLILQFVQFVILFIIYRQINDFIMAHRNVLHSHTSLPKMFQIATNISVEYENGTSTSIALNIMCFINDNWIQFHLVSRSLLTANPAIQMLLPKWESFLAGPVHCCCPSKWKPMFLYLVHWIWILGIYHSKLAAVCSTALMVVLFPY